MKMCSRTSTAWPGWSGSEIISPGASREKAMRPGPTAWVMISGMPASIRFHAPLSDMALTLTWVSIQSSTWWEK